jgi:hypothetical protein
VSVGNGIAAGFYSKNLNLPVLSVSAKHVGVTTVKGFTPIVRKGDTIPVTNHSFFRNEIPFEKNLSIDFLQSGSLFSGHSKIASLHIPKLTNLDKDGHANIKVGVTLRLDGTLTMTSSEGGVLTEVHLEFLPEVVEEQEDLQVRRMRKAIGKLNATDLTSLVDEFALTRDKTLVARFNEELVKRR